MGSFSAPGHPKGEVPMLAKLGILSLGMMVGGATFLAVGVACFVTISQLQDRTMQAWASRRHPKCTRFRPGPRMLRSSPTLTYSNSGGTASFRPIRYRMHLRGACPREPHRKPLCGRWQSARGRGPSWPSIGKSQTTPREEEPRRYAGAQFGNSRPSSLGSTRDSVCACAWALS
jgi:hypothetical protein